MKRCIGIGLVTLLLLVSVSTGCTTSVPTIEVTYPNEGETWDDIGRPVSFKAQGVKQVNIDLEDWRGEPAGGPFTWRLETHLPVESSGKYAVTAIKDLSPMVQSGDRFKILVYDAANEGSRERTMAGDRTRGYFSITITP